MTNFWSDGDKSSQLVSFALHESLYQACLDKDLNSIKFFAERFDNWHPTAPVQINTQVNVNKNFAELVGEDDEIVLSRAV